MWSSCLTRTEEGRYEENRYSYLTITLIAAICGSFYIVNDKSKRANPKDTYKQSVTADYKIAADSDTETE